MTLLSVLIVVANFDYSDDSNRLASEVNAFKANLRYAQALGFAQTNLSGNDRVIWGIVPSGGTTYTLDCPTAGEGNVKFPRSTDINYTTTNGVRVAGNSVYFDFRGRPVNMASTPNGADVTFTLSLGSLSDTVTVVQNTGLVR